MSAECEMPKEVDKQQVGAYFSRQLQKTLSLDGSPVAVAISAEPVERLREWRRKATLCMMIQSARQGASFFCPGSSIFCGGGEHIGIGKSSAPDIINSLVDNERLVASKAAAEKRIEEVKHRVPQKGNFISLSPLEKAPFIPQAVVIAGTPLQISRIVHLDAFETGIIDAVYGEPLCSAVIATPITTGKPGLSLLDITCRGFGRYPAEEMAIGIPYGRLKRIVDSIEESSSGNRRPEFLEKVLNRIT